MYNVILKNIEIKLKNSNYVYILIYICIYTQNLHLYTYIIMPENIKTNVYVFFTGKQKYS